MKKIIIALTVLLASFSVADAQKVAYVNTETILAAIPDYEAAQVTLEALGDKYKAAVETELGKVEALYQNYQSTRHMMTAQQRQNAENEIIAKERVAQEKQKIYFGEGGIMAKKAEEMLDPIRKNVEKAIEAVARSEGYDLVIDVAALQGVVYKNEALDISRRVIDRYFEIR